MTPVDVRMLFAGWLSATCPLRCMRVEKVGVRPLRAAYQWLVEELRVSAVVLVDGGTNILMRGDEVGLGTPAEDMSSLAAVSKLNGIEGFVASIGFGIDAFHGFCHSLVLENIASLTRKGGYLGAFSVTPDSAEGPAYLDAVDRAQQQTSLLPVLHVRFTDGGPPVALPRSPRRHRDDTRGRRAHRDIRAARGCATLGDLSTLTVRAGCIGGRGE